MFTISEVAVPLTDRRALDGVRAVEFTDMFMGPMVALSLADLGADSIKVEILNEVGIRLLVGSGASCFRTYNGSKRCLCIDLGAGTGGDLTPHLVPRADVVIDDFCIRALAEKFLDHDALSGEVRGLIDCSSKGLVEGSARRSDRAREVGADEGRPSPCHGAAGQTDARGRIGSRRCGCDVWRHRNHGRTARVTTHRHGQEANSALARITAFLVLQYMAQKAATGAPAPSTALEAAHYGEICRWKGLEPLRWPSPK